MAAALLFLSVFAKAGTPDFAWLTTARGTGSEIPRHIAVDDAGNSYIVGWFNSTNLSFGNGIAITNTSLAAGPPMDSFVAKYNATGAVVWAQKLGGTNDDRAPGIAVDRQQNCYVTGGFSSTNFYIGNMILTNFAPNGNGSFYIAKFNPLGNLTWVRNALPGSYSSGGAAVVTDNALNCYVAAGFSGTNNIGGTILISRGFTDVVLLKYDPLGNLVWAQQAGGTGSDSATAIALDGAGNVSLVANSTSSTTTFGSLVLTNHGSSATDILIAKYDPTGTVLWARCYGGEATDAGRGLAIDRQDNCYITGDFYSTNFILGNLLLTNSPIALSASFVAKLNSTGEPLWARAIRGDYVNSSLDVAVDFVGNSYIAGYFQSSNLVFDTMMLTNTEAEFLNDADAFVAKYNANGNLLWVAQPLGTDEQRIYSIAVDSLANAYVCGWTQGTNVLFGKIATTNTFLDLFVAKMESDYPLLQITRTNQTAIISWPAKMVGFVPEVTSDFQTWSSIAGSITTNGNQTILTRNISNSNGFFRLRKPN